MIPLKDPALSDKCCMPVSEEGLFHDLPEGAGVNVTLDVLDALAASSFQSRPVSEGAIPPPGRGNDALSPKGSGKTVPVLREVRQQLCCHWSADAADTAAVVTAAAPDRDSEAFNPTEYPGECNLWSALSPRAARKLSCEVGLVRDISLALGFRVSESGPRACIAEPLSFAESGAVLVGRRGDTGGYGGRVLAS